METLGHDIRFALRALRRQPGFAFAALLCLALGVGLTTALFTVVNAILLRPLPVVEPDRLVSVFWLNPERDITDDGVSFADLAEFEGTGVFESLGGAALRNVTLTRGDMAERVNAASITPDLLTLIGARPERGRTFTAADGATIGFERAVILGHGVWQRQFGGAEDVLGRTLEINGRALEVIGVMPAGFRFPERQDLWLPLSPTAATADARALWGIGRLRDGVTIAAADAQVRAAGERIRAREAANPDQVHAGVLGYRDSIVDAPARRALWLMFAAVGLVLLIACANVANLLLARATDRRRELALRAALGASRVRVVRQLLTESALLSAAGAAAGVLFAVWWVDAITGRIPEELAYWIRFDLDATVLLFTVAVAATTTFLFGVMPALHATRAAVHEDLRQGSRAGGSREGARIRSGLVVAEIALSLVLLVAAGLMLQSFMRVMRADPGFDARPLLTLRAQLVGDRYDEPAARAEFWQQAATRLRTTTGVRAAAITSAIPADDGGPTTTVQHPRAVGRDVHVMQFASTDGYFDALDVSLLAGRDFRPDEVRDTASRVVILGQTLARTLFEQDDAIGRTLRIGPALREHVVIGVAPDLQYDEFGEDVVGTRHQLHLPYARQPWRGMSLIVRAAGDPAAIAPAVAAALRAADPYLVPYEVMTFEERRHFTQWNVAMLGSAFTSFGGLALLLALAGIYGVMSYTVARRRHELGVRLALGASPAGVTALMLGRGARLTLAGTLLGLLGAVAAGRFLQGLLYEVQATAPATLAAVAAVLATAALLACWIPARRAAAADPLEALRSE